MSSAREDRRARRNLCRSSQEYGARPRRFVIKPRRPDQAKAPALLERHVLRCVATPQDAARRSGRPETSPLGHLHRLKAVIGDNCMGIGEAGTDVRRFQIRIIVEDRLFPSSPCANRLRISSTEMRRPRTIGLPPKIAGSAVIRLRTRSSISVAPGPALSRVAPLLSAYTAHPKAATTISMGKNRMRLSAGYSMNSAQTT